MKTKLKRNTLSLAFTIAFIAVVVLINVILGVVSDRYGVKADLTNGKLYTLDETTEFYLENRLNDDVVITVLNSEQTFIDDANNRQVDEILKKMETSNSHIRLEYVNLDKNPNYTSKFKDETVDTNYIVVECGKTGRHRIISPVDYFGLTSEEALMYYQYYGYVQGYFIEQETVSALMFTTDETPVRIAFTEGYGETDSTALQNLLSNNGFTVETLNLLTVDEIDTTLDFIVVHSPTIDMEKEQLLKLDKFLDNNGEYGKSIMYFASVAQPQTPNIDSFLSDWGLSVGYSDIGQSDDRYLVSAVTRFFHIQQICDTPFTEGVYGSNLFALGADLRPVFTSGNTDAKTRVLMKTYDGAFLYPLDYEGESFDYSGVEKGEYNDAVVSTKTLSDGTPSRVFVFGSDTLSSSYLMAYGNGINSKFFTNLFNIISGREVGITITEKVPVSLTFDMSAKTANTLALVLCVVIPVLITAAGIAVYIRRRHR
ncbi:MAG: Gldg family protein [Oscillospiraceae bacterium]